MKPLFKFCFLLLFALFALPAHSQLPSPQEVKALMKRVADWQIAHYRDSYTYKEPHHPLDWTNGALYVGMTKWAAMADDETYYQWLKKVGEDNKWNLHSRRYHADDHTVGQMYCELYRKYGDKKMIEPTIKSFDYLLYHPSKSKLDWETPFHQDRWNWCDALFMSPPVWAKLYKITGERKYLDFMVAEYKATTDFLFDKKNTSTTAIKAIWANSTTGPRSSGPGATAGFRRADQRPQRAGPRQQGVRVLFGHL